MLEVQGNCRMGNALSRSRERKLGKALTTKKQGIPKRNLDDVLKTSCTWPAGKQDIRRIDHEHK